MGLAGASVIALTIFTIVHIRKRNKVERQIIDIINPGSWKIKEIKTD